MMNYYTINSMKIQQNGQQFFKKAFVYVVSWVKVVFLWITFHWSMFLRVQLNKVIILCRTSRNLLYETLLTNARDAVTQYDLGHNYPLWPSDTI